MEIKCANMPKPKLIAAAYAELFEARIRKASNPEAARNAVISALKERPEQGI